MKTPHRKLIALAVLSALASSASAIELTLDNLNVNGSDLYYIHSTSSEVNVIHLDSPTTLQYSEGNKNQTFTAIYAEGDVVFQNDLNLGIKTNGVSETIGLRTDSSAVTANSLRIKVHATNGNAVSLMTYKSSLALEGQFELIAKQYGELGIALDAYDSEISLTSLGHSKIEGN